MKNGKLTVTPQNMVEYQISIRDADAENDMFREAFEALIKDDNLTPEQQFFALDIFKGGWEAAVRLLNDDDEAPTRGKFTVDDLLPGETFFAPNQGTAITPTTEQVKLVWVGPNAVQYRLNREHSGIRETSIERFLEIINQ